MAKKKKIKKSYFQSALSSPHVPRKSRGHKKNLKKKEASFAQLLLEVLQELVVR